MPSPTKKNFNIKWSRVDDKSNKAVLTPEGRKALKEADLASGAKA